jgi:hypothetical protein
LFFTFVFYFMVSFKLCVIENDVYNHNVCFEICLIFVWTFCFCFLLIFLFVIFYCSLILFLFLFFFFSFSNTYLSFWALEFSRFFFLSLILASILFCSNLILKVWVKKNCCFFFFYFIFLHNYFNEEEPTNTNVQNKDD